MATEKDTEMDGTMPPKVTHWPTAEEFRGVDLLSPAELRRQEREQERMRKQAEAREEYVATFGPTLGEALSSYTMDQLYPTFGDLTLESKETIRHHLAEALAESLGSAKYEDRVLGLEALLKAVEMHASLIRPPKTPHFV
ncbi:MAG: hypothetical protein V1808_00030 [Candidatus Daviesbacteria bacterium]